MSPPQSKLEISSLVYRLTTTCGIENDRGNACRAWASLYSFKFLSFGGSVVDNTLDYQSVPHKIDRSLLRSFGRDFKPRSRLRIKSLLVRR